MPRLWIATAMLVMAALGASRAGAQLVENTSPSSLGSASPGSTLPGGPALSAAAISPRFTLANGSRTASELAVPQRRPFGLSQTLMIVGGATFLAGAIIGGDAGTVIMIGGAGVGLYGLYLFLREPSATGLPDHPAAGLGYRAPARL